MLSEINDIIDERMIPTLNDAGLTRSQSHLLYILWSAGPSRLSALAEQQRCVRSNVTRLVRTLEQQGILEKTEDPSDKRARLISLTKAGRATFEPVLQEYQHLEHELLADLDETEHRALLRLALRAAAILDRPSFSAR
ncbi:MAG: MarR family transcriptional regulator [Myxococcota bacterium]